MGFFSAAGEVSKNNEPDITVADKVRKIANLTDPLRPFDIHENKEDEKV